MTGRILTRESAHCPPVATPRGFPAHDRPAVRCGLPAARGRGVSDDAPVVRIAQGQVRGFWRDGRSAAFLGIPFAEAPVGEHRFAAPVPAAGWDGVRDATEFGPTPQRRPFGEVTAIPEPSFPGDATLNVNVFTPVPGEPDARLPVLVWIHGGGFKAGSPASPWYDGLRLQPRRRGHRVDLLPAGLRRLRLDPRRPAQPRPARPARGPAVGAGQHRRVRRRPGPGDHRRAVRRWRLGLGAAGLAAGHGAVLRGHQPLGGAGPPDRRRGPPQRRGPGRAGRRRMDPGRPVPAERGGRARPAGAGERPAPARRSRRRPGAGSSLPAASISPSCPTSTARCCRRASTTRWPPASGPTGRWSWAAPRTSSPPPGRCSRRCWPGRT